MGKGLKRFCECTALFLVSGAIGLIWNAVSPGGIALVGEWDAENGVISAMAKNNPVIHDIEIDSVVIAKELFDAGQSVFLDARPADIYNDGHIKGAYSLPIGGFDDGIERFFEDHPFSVPIITYCTGRECQDSHELAQLLLEIGYSDVKVFIDGYPAWEDKGFPVENAAVPGGGM
jgi:rhodanese-related sulfurtransferase